MATLPACRLYGDAVSPDSLSRLATRYSMSAAPAGTKPNGHDICNLLILGEKEISCISDYLSQPYSAYIELVDEENPVDGEVLQGLAEGKLCFSFATSTIYQMDGAAVICDALTQRGILSAMRRPDVELSLHESISNAVVHGNLALASNTKGDLGNYAKFAQELQQRMVSPEAKKRVNVLCSWDHEFLDITITDKGSGYDESKLPANIDPFAPAGRGLAIMRSLTLAMNVTHGGRVVTLRFLT